MLLCENLIIYVEHIHEDKIIYHIYYNRQRNKNFP